MTDDLKFETSPSHWLRDSVHATALLGAYLSDGLYSGALWDPAIERRRAGDASNVIDVEDLYSPTLLSAPIDRRAGQEILQRSDAVSRHLLAIPANLELWDENSAAVDDALGHADALVTELQLIDEIGWTKASKLVAAKRPDLIPIWDTQVSGAVGAPSKMSWVDYWREWRNAFTPGTVTTVRTIAANLGHPDLSPLRAMDIIIWMDVWGWRSLPDTDEWPDLRSACDAKSNPTP